MQARLKNDMKSFKVKYFRQILKQLSLCMGILVITQLSLLANPSQVIPIRLTFSVYHLDTREFAYISRQSCPTEFNVTQTSHRNEGGATIEGSASLGWLAGPFKIENSDEFSVTWVAKLQAKYHNCQATARITKIGDKPFNGHSYLRMRFIHENAYLILDMTGLTAGRDSMPAIVKQDVKDGNPTWSWASPH